MRLSAPEELSARRAAVDGSVTLHRLAARLAVLLDPLLRQPLHLPREKALLSRDGGVCARDGARLAFDPFQGNRHRCPRCGREYRGPRHDRAWIWRYHLWLSERAIHLALLARLGRPEPFASTGQAILSAYASLYPTLPNRDNVLGPTRPFFSTYLESIWLTQLLVAASLLEGGGLDQPRAALTAVVRESAGLIASFDEKWSNRQVWNNVALLAAGQWLGDEGLVHRAVHGPNGLRSQLTHAVTDEGLWYEGENYHFFALRGFLLGAELLRGVDHDLYADPVVGPRLGAMYLAPLDTLLPDLTLPARGDAPYGVSLRQPRFAELWEIGRVRTGEPRIEALLSTLYDPDVPPGQDPGVGDIAEQERNQAPGRVERSALGWKALLWMEAADPVATGAWACKSRLLGHAGIAVLRPAPQTCVSLEVGGARGGHGHPDLLHLSLFAGTPLLADFGTGSYTTDSLFWYRSAAAHNAPGRAGSGQLARHGWCRAFDAREDWAWCQAEAVGVFGPRTWCRRAVLAASTYVLDRVEISAPPGVTVDLPLHPVGGVHVETATLRPSGRGAADVGPRCRAIGVLGKPPQRLAVRGEGGNAFEVLLVPRRGEQVLVVEAPGPPDLHLAEGVPTSFVVRRASGAGTWTQLYALRPGAVSGLEATPRGVAVRLGDGRTERITLDEGRAEIAVTPEHRVTLGGGRAGPSPQAGPSAAPAPRSSLPCHLLDALPAADTWRQRVPEGAVVALGEHHYRRSELPYGAAGPFAAQVAVFAVGSRICFAADVTKEQLCFRPSDAPDPALDNEVPDIHSDGVQCYVGVPEWAGYLLVPEPGASRVRVHAVRGTAAEKSRAVGSWKRTSTGYAMVVAVDVGRPLAPGETMPVGLVVNEMYPDRERRAGQLALCGGGGWVYLRGDRERPSEALLAEVR